MILRSDKVAKVSRSEKRRDREKHRQSAGCNSIIISFHSMAFGRPDSGLPQWRKCLHPIQGRGGGKARGGEKKNKRAFAQLFDPLDLDLAGIALPRVRAIFFLLFFFFFTGILIPREYLAAERFKLLRR